MSLSVDTLIKDALSGLCDECGIVLEKERLWVSGADGVLTLPLKSDTHSIAIAHDERDAPYACAPDGSEDSLLISLADEGPWCCVAWAAPSSGSRLLGIGIDLASTEDFSGEVGEHFMRLLFSDRERVIGRSVHPDDDAQAGAFAFSAKEAAFKACARPLRTWYASHDEELFFEVRDFELADTTHAAGTARSGRAQAAMDKMGIAEIRIASIFYADMALTVACALEA